MAKVILSDPEKLFIIHGVQDNVRNDGRSCMDYRVIEIETDVIPNCSGSAFVKLGDTKILAGVKAEIDKPLFNTPNHGRIEVAVQCPAFAHFEFSGKPEGQLLSISRTLTEACNQRKSLDFESLCIIPEKQVWVLYVDITVLVYSQNLIDAASIALKAALFDTKIPSVTVKNDGENEPEIEISDDPYDVVRLDVQHFPCVIGLHRVGTQFIVDPTEEEDCCSKANLVMAVSDVDVVMMKEECKGGSLHIETIIEILETGKEMGKTLNKQLMSKLKSETSSPFKKMLLVDLI